MDDTYNVHKCFSPVAWIKPIQVFRFLENGNIGLDIQIANVRANVTSCKNGAKLGVICSVIKSINAMRKEVYT